MTARGSGRPAPLRIRYAPAALLVACLTLGLGGCADPGPIPTTSAPVVSSVPSLVAAPTSTASALPSAGAAPVDLQSSLDRLFAAGVAGDRARWDAGIDTRDAGFADRSGVLFDNLGALRPTRLRVRLTGVEQPVPAARRAVLGSGAHLVQARLDWRLRGERADATSMVWLTLVAGPAGAEVAGTEDRAGLDTPAVPLWWLAPTTRATRGSVTVLAGPGQDAGRWLRLASHAAADARTHLPAALRHGWDGHLVVEVPGDASAFARVLGTTPTAYAGTAAVTRPEGPTTRAAVRVVVNPAVAADPAAELGATLVHETVHVATRSTVSSAPLWAVEGLAEHVALAAHPDQRTDELALLRGTRRPTRLPSDSAFRAGATEVAATYAQAWLVCEAVVEHRGRADLGRFYTALDQGQPVGAAARATLGVDDATLVQWWRDALDRAGAGPRG